MPITTSDGQTYDSEAHYLLDLPTQQAGSEDVKSDPVTKKDSQKEPLRLTIHPKKDDMTPGPTSGTGEDLSGQEPLSEPKEVHIVRHGETTENASNTVRGWEPVSLNENGIAEAHKAGKELKDKGVDLIVSSDLQRAKETAEIIKKETGAEVQYDPRLRTWNVGEHAGKPCKESNPVLKDYVQNKPDEQIPGGESFNEFTNRSFSGIRDAILNNKDREVAILTHNRVEATLKGWENTGQDNPDIDTNEAVKEETEPGAVRSVTFHPDASILQPGPATGVKLYPGKGPKTQSDTPFSQWANRMGENAAGSIKDLIQHPENIVGTGELSPALGVFGGKQALTANLEKLTKAVGYQKKGMSNDYLFRKTGWYQDIDGHWKHYIPEGNLKTENLNNISINKTDPLYTVPMNILKRGGTKLPDIYDNPALFEAYPQLKDIQVLPELNLDYKGSFDPDKNILKLSGSRPNEMHSILVHELQHAIQEIEGFPGGSNMKAVSPVNLDNIQKILNNKWKELDSLLTEAGISTADKFAVLEMSKKEKFFLSSDKNLKYAPPHWRNVAPILKERPDLVKAFKNYNESNDLYNDLVQKVFETYKRIAGEVEARNAQTWAKMNKTERKLSTPDMTRDTPAKDILIKPRADTNASEQSPYESLNRFRGKTSENNGGWSEERLIKSRIRQIQYDLKLSFPNKEDRPPHGELNALRERLRELK